MPQQNMHLRASDTDREQVAAELGDHLTAGRLDQAEFDTRLSAAYTARTYGELDALLTDLPATRARPSTPPPEPPAGPSTPRPHVATPFDSRAGRFGPWLAVSLIVTAVWALTSLTTGDVHGFWPVWVIGPWGLALLLGLCHGGRHHRRLPPHRL